MINEKGVTHVSRRGRDKVTYLAISPLRTEGADYQMFPCRGGS